MLASDPEGDDAYIFITSMFGGAVVQRLLNGCLSTRLPAYDSEDNSGSSTLSSGQEIKFNRQVSSYIVLPDFLRGFKPPESTVYPFYEFDFLKHLRENSETMDGVKHLALGSDPLKVLNVQLDHQSVLDSIGFIGDSRIYPWGFDTNMFAPGLPPQWADFRERVLAMFTGGTVYTCAPEWCDRYPNDLFCKCKYRSAEVISDNCRGDPACIYIITHPECNGQLSGGPAVPKEIVPAIGLSLTTERNAIGAAFGGRRYTKARLLGTRMLPTRLFCGDGIKTKRLSEECDDGNNLDGDGCSHDCRKEAFCGDGKIAGSEECDSQDPSGGPSCKPKLKAEGGMFGPEGELILNAVRCTNCMCELYTVPEP